MRLDEEKESSEEVKFDAIQYPSGARDVITRPVYKHRLQQYFQNLRKKRDTSKYGLRNLKILDPSPLLEKDQYGEENVDPDEEHDDDGGTNLNVSVLNTYPGDNRSRTPSNRK